MARPKTGSVTERSPGVWRLTWELGRDPNTGKRQQKRETFRGTRAAADKRWRQVQAELDQGRRAAVQTGPTLQTVFDLWLAAEPRKPTTIQNYRDLWRLYLAPRWATTPVTDLSPLAIQQALTAWRTAPRQDGKPGHLSATTVHSLFVLVRALLAQAERWDLIPSNPAKKVKAPPKSAFTPRQWTNAEVRRFLEVARTDRYAIAFELALFAGLRRGEILGLRWNAIDWDAGTLTVAAQRVKVGRQDVPSTPKSAAGFRTIALDAATVQALRHHRDRQAEDRRRAGAAYRDHGLVLQTALGTPVGSRNLDRSAARVMEMAGVPRLRLHDLRHMQGTALLAQGVDLKTIAARLGHSQISTTAKFYLHPGADQQREGAEAVRELWSPREGGAFP